MSLGLLDLVFTYVIRIIEETRVVEFNRNPVLAFMNHITILGNYQEKAIEITEKLIRAGERTSLIIGEENIKYAKVSRKEHNLGAIFNIKINQYTFQRVEDSFRYLGILINMK